MQRLLLCAGIACAACSSTPAPELGASTSRTIEIAGMSGKLTINSSSNASVAQLPYSVEQVWRVLPAAFDSLGVKVGVVDPAQHMIGNEGFKVRVQLGRTPLSRYMDCGQTQVGPNADSYDVYLVVLTHAQAASGGASLTTRFEAMAKPIAFSQGYSACSSRGLFEARLAEAVKQQLAR